MLNKLALIAIATGGVFAAVPAQAQQLTPRQDWRVLENTDRCTLFQAYGEPGQVDLIIHELPDIPFVFTVSDARWDVSEGDVGDVRFELDGKPVSGRIMAMTKPRNDLPGYAIVAEPAVHDRFAAGKVLRVYRRGAMIADLSLAGIREPMDRVAKCFAKLGK